MQKDEGSLELLAILVKKWFPGRKIDVDSMAEASFLEWDFWEKMRKTIHGNN